MPDFSLLNPDLIELDVEADTRQDILERLANLLISKGYAKQSYLDAVIEREKVFPTGLATESMGVAIPHADIIHVNKPAIAMAILKNPVKFRVMGSPEEEIDAKLVFMLAIKDPNMQLKLLQDLIEIFQDKRMLMCIVNSKDVKSIIAMIDDFLKSINSDKAMKNC